MLDIKFIRQHPDLVKAAIQSKQIDLDLNRVLDLDRDRRRLSSKIEGLRARRNELSARVPTIIGLDRKQVIDESKLVGEELKQSETELTNVLPELEKLLLLVPSIPAVDVPIGYSEDDNVEIRRWGEPKKFDFVPRDHVDILTSLGLVEFDGPRRYAGSRSYALVGDGALLELAITKFALDFVVDRGFTAISPPVMVRASALEGTGFFPLGYEDTYHVGADDLFLTGTSEVGLVSLLSERILEEISLPIRFVGSSTCFRREAGSAGRDTRGLYRVHQFQKIEQVIFCSADAEVSIQEHDLLLRNSEDILRSLNLPHRVALACTAELGIGQVRKHEIETWMPSRQTYSETHSCSTLHDFQARRSNIRYRNKDGDIQFVHTLNNTAIASPRILIPLLENYQNEDGSVTIPDVLRPYMGGRKTISATQSLY